MTGNKTNHKTIVIDRTLPEIRSSLLRMSRLDILDLSWMLMNIGADLVETDAELLEKMGRLPEGLAFILKVTGISDLEACGRLGIKRCVMRRPLFEKPGAAELIKKEGLFAVLEVRANSIGGIRRLEELKAMKDFDSLSCIRITGLGRLDTPEWLEIMNDVRAALGKEIDICPVNRFSMGNAIALEAAAGGMDYVTASFSGFGCGRSYASLEVVLSAMKLRKVGGRKMNPDVLALLHEQFEKCARVRIAKKRHSFSGYSFDSGYAREAVGRITAAELIDA